MGRFLNFNFFFDDEFCGLNSFQCPEREQAKRFSGFSQFHPKNKSIQHEKLLCRTLLSVYSFPISLLYLNDILQNNNNTNTHIPAHDFHLKFFISIKEVEKIPKDFWYYQQPVSTRHVVHIFNVYK